MNTYNSWKFLIFTPTVKQEHLSQIYKLVHSNAINNTQQPNASFTKKYLY